MAYNRNDIFKAAKQKIAKWDPKARGPEGRKLCCWCGKEIPPRRQRWCSQACVDEYISLSSQTGFRQMVYKRDRGICELCGLDTEKLERVSRLLQWEYRHPKITKALVEKYSWALYDWQGRPKTVRSGSLWDADHRIPLVEGGAPGLENARTLCIQCHKVQTKELSRRRAERRRGGDSERSPAGRGGPETRSPEAEGSAEAGIVRSR